MAIVIYFSLQVYIKKTSHVECIQYNKKETETLLDRPYKFIFHVKYHNTLRLIR